MAAVRNLGWLEVAAVSGERLGAQVVVVECTEKDVIGFAPQELGDVARWDAAKPLTGEPLTAGEQLGLFIRFPAKRLLSKPKEAWGVNIASFSRVCRSFAEPVVARPRFSSCSVSCSGEAVSTWRRIEEAVVRSCGEEVW